MIAAAFLISPGVARAWETTVLNPDGSLKTEANTALRNLNTTGTTQGSTDTLERARRASRILRPLRVLGIIGLTATGAEVAWELGSWDGQPVYRLITGGGIGTNAPGTGSGFAANHRLRVTGYRFVSQGSIVQHTWTAPVGAWYATKTECTSAGCTPAATGGDWAVSLDTGFAELYDPANCSMACQLAQQGSTLVQSPQQSSVGFGYRLPNAAEGLSTTPMTQTQYQNFTGTKVSQTGAYALDQGTSSDLEAGGSAFGQPGTRTPGEDQAGQDLCAAMGGANCESTLTFLMPDLDGMTVAQAISALQAAGHTGSVVQTELGLNSAVITKPAGAVVTQSIPANTTASQGSDVTISYNPDPLPIEVFNPSGNETWPEYLSRLQGSGYVGTVGTPVVLDPTFANPTYGPNVPVRIRIRQPGLADPPFTVLFPVAPPVPRLWPDDPIVPELNPPNTPSVPDFPGDGPGTGLPPGTVLPPGVPPPDPGDCFCPPPEFNINWPNLTERFPFGIFTYLGSFLDQLSGPSERPEFTINKPDGLGGGTITISFEAAEEYRETAHDVIKVIVVLAAVYFLATVILGVGKGERLEASSD